jgi:hypothetical protein
MGDGLMTNPTPTGLTQSPPIASKSGETNFSPPRLATVYTQVLLFVYEAFCPLNPRQVTAVAPLGETPRPRCLLYLGRPQDRTGSPILGDFETPAPPRIGGLGGKMTNTA